ncbi:hypothetical protein ACFIOY_35375 [Bradyrhizobium sp. TZ2]
MFKITNKGIAHGGEDIKGNPDHCRLIEITSRGVPSLVVSYLYTPLGLPAHLAGLGCPSRFAVDTTSAVAGAAICLIGHLPISRCIWDALFMPQIAACVRF